MAGFTLIEVMLVMVITAVAFTAIYGLYANTIKADVENRYEVVASNLAQEGVELIRNIRDKNVLNGSAINAAPLGGATCNPTWGSSPGCGASTQVCLSDHYYNGASCGSSATPFDRTCSLAYAPGVLTVTCTVSWESFVNGVTRTATAKSVLTDWQ